MSLKVVHEISLPDSVNNEDVDVTSSITVRVPRRKIEQTVQFIPSVEDFVLNNNELHFYHEQQIPEDNVESLYTPQDELVSSWTSANTYNGSPAPGWSYGRAICADSSGNYWIGGNFFNGKLKFGSVATLDSAGKHSVFVAKFSSSNVPLFAVMFPGVASSDLPDVTGIACDSTGAVWVQGYYQGGVNIGGVVLSSPSRNSLYLVKLSSAGTILLRKNSVNASNVIPKRIRVDSSDNVFSVGAYISNMSIDGVAVPTSTYNEVFVYKLNSSGVVQNKVASSGTSSHFVVGNDLTLDSSGNIYVVGTLNNSTKFGSTTLSGGTYGNLFVAKLNSSMSWSTAVTVAFTGTPAATANSTGNGIALDNSGNLYITGRFQTGSGGFLTFGSNALSTVPFDVYVAQLNTSLVFGSGNQAFTGDGVGNALARDANGDVWATGVLKGPSCNFSGTIVNSANYNYYLAKINSSCVFSGLTSGAASSGSSVPNDIAVDSSNRLTMTGYAVGSVVFGSNSVSGASNKVFAAMYSI